MKIKCRLFANLIFVLIACLTLILFSVHVAKPFSRIISKVDIVDVIGLKIVREECNSESENVRYKLTDVPQNIHILEAKIMHSGQKYNFSNQDNVLLDSQGKVVSSLSEENYTLILNTKELGEIYKIISKSDYGYKVLDIKVSYNKCKNALDISNSDDLFKDSEVTIFKNDTKVGTSKLDEQGKASVYLNDIQNLSTSTYTVLAKKGSEILGIDAFHITPVYRELNLKDNVKLSITSNISNKLKISVNSESGITQNDKVQVISVYEESNPNENLLLNLDENSNLISNLNGEILLKDSLVKGKKYRVKLKINGVEISSQDCCSVHIKGLDVSKIKATVVEKIGRELKIDLSGIDNLTQEDLIEVVSLHDLNNRDKNFISPTKLTNKVNEVQLLDQISFSDSYEVSIKINDFVLDSVKVEVIPVDLSNSIALTDIISNKIFISLENTRGLKITDCVKVIGVFKEGHNDKNFLKSSYNTEIKKLNGTVFINHTLDTKSNYYLKFMINDVEFENPVKITVNNDISFAGVSAKTKLSSQEVEVCFKNVDAINNNDLIEVKSIFEVNDGNSNLIDNDKQVKISGKTGIIHLKTPILENHSYGMKVKINNVDFDEIIPIVVEDIKTPVKITTDSGKCTGSIRKVVDISSIEFGDGYIKFPHNLDSSINYDSSVCYIPSVESEINSEYITVSNLIPYKTYESVNIIVKNDTGNVVEFEIPEFNCSESDDHIKNFISKTYIKLKNGLNNDVKSFEFADEVVFSSWYNKIKKGEVDLRKFVFDVIDEENFFENYGDKCERMRILYNIIFGINPTDQSLSVWLNDLDKIMKDEKEYNAFKIVIEKMFTNSKFKSLEKQLK